MAISCIRVWELVIPFRDGPYAMSHVVMEAVYSRVYAVTSDDGAIGLGDGAFARRAAGGAGT